jgi:hypothetical protein
MTLPINFNDFIGPETIDREYKEFTFNYSGSLIDNKIAESYCQTNHFNFNEEVLSNIQICLDNFLPKYVCGFFNSNIKGDFYIGINDFGFIKGIPYSGKLPHHSIKMKMKQTINESIQNSKNPNLKLNNFVKIHFIKLNKPTLPNSPINEKYLKFLEDREHGKILYKEYLERLDNWKIRFAFVNQKLVDLVNNYESRIMLIEYIKKFDSTNPVVKLLMTDYKLEYRNHSQVTILKDIPTDPYYWITRWKDEMIKKLKKEKPHFINPYNCHNTPMNLITGVSDMIPFWMNYNNNMKLYVIHIEIIPPNIKKIKNGYYSYYDIHTKRWMYCRRMLLENGDPICNPT